MSIRSIPEAHSTSEVGVACCAPYVHITINPKGSGMHYLAIVSPKEAEKLAARLRRHAKVARQAHRTRLAMDAALDAQIYADTTPTPAPAEATGEVATRISDADAARMGLPNPYHSGDPGYDEYEAAKEPHQ